MENLATTFDANEQAWVSDELSLNRNIYLTINLFKAGKVVIRQNCGDGIWYRIPIRKHRDTSKFNIRIKVPCASFKIKIFASTQPKEIKYAYI